MVDARTERPGPRWRVALRRLPVTLAVLLVVGGSAAGLAYVASGSGIHRFPATLTNDLGTTVEVGACEEADCTPGGLVTSFQVAPGSKLEVGLRVGPVNPILIRTLGAKRIGCLFLRYAKRPPRPLVVRLSAAHSC